MTMRRFVYVVGTVVVVAFLLVVIYRFIVAPTISPITEFAGPPDTHDISVLYIDASDSRVHRIQLGQPRESVVVSEVVFGNLAARVIAVPKAFSPPSDMDPYWEVALLDHHWDLYANDGTDSLDKLVKVVSDVEGSCCVSDAFYIGSKLTHIQMSLRNQADVRTLPFWIFGQKRWILSGGRTRSELAIFDHQDDDSTIARYYFPKQDVFENRQFAGRIGDGLIIVTTARNEIVIFDAKQNRRFLLARGYGVTLVKGWNSVPVLSTP